MKISFQGIEDVYFMQKTADLMAIGYEIFESLTDTMCFLEKLSESAGLPANYDGLSLYAFMAWLHSTFPREDALKVASNRTR